MSPRLGALQSAGVLWDVLQEAGSQCWLFNFVGQRQQLVPGFGDGGARRFSLAEPVQEKQRPPGAGPQLVEGPLDVDVREEGGGRSDRGVAHEMCSRIRLATTPGFSTWTK